MGWLMRSKLKSLPIYDYNIPMFKAIVVALSLKLPGPWWCEVILNNAAEMEQKLSNCSDAEFLKKCVNGPLSLAQSDAYIEDDKNVGFFRDIMPVRKWLVNEGVLVQYMAGRTAIALRMPALPVKFFVRTGDNSWFTVCDWGEIGEEI